MLAARRPCPPNKSSAAKKAKNAIHNPINNPTNNPTNNPINSLKRKMDNRDANLQAVLDDEAISTTMKMSDGTSATVPLLTDIAWTDVHA